LEFDPFVDVEFVEFEEQMDEYAVILLALQLDEDDVDDADDDDDEELVVNVAVDGRFFFAHN
jgi:hypothetical protein